MEFLPLILILLLFLGFALLSKRIDGSMVTPPMIFVGAGLLFSGGGFGVADFQVEYGVLHLLLEATLVLVLFSDAARIDLANLRKDHTIPQRMLVFGLPLCILVGTGVAYALPLGLILCEAALLAAILAPTDAALGQAVVSSKAVPLRIRESLCVESGLNDGIALPLVLVLASVASAIATHEVMNWLQFAVLQLVFGPLAGVVVGYGGGRVLNAMEARGWVSQAGQGIISLVLAGLCFLLAEAFHGNGFIAAFVGGLVLGNTLKRSHHALFEFVETEGQLLTLSAFFLFGALLLPSALVGFEVWHWVFAGLSLTVLRMVPVVVSLLGLNLKVPTQLFLGWFGPRGLASLLFMLLVMQETELQNGETITHIVFITVLLSAVLHGVSAAPLARVYGGIAAGYPGCAENKPVGGKAVRGGSAGGSAG